MTAILFPPLGTDVEAQSRKAAPKISSSDKPLVLAKQGSFFVNQQDIATAFPAGSGTPAPGHISVKGMYVQYQIPASRRHGMYPVIMVHGSGHTGKTYEETPDGRIGWAEYFVRHGIPVYVVDHSGRARSGFDPTPINKAKLEKDPALIPAFAEFTNEQAWTGFRSGPAAFTAYEKTQFPVSARDQYFAQIVPNTETSYPDAGDNTIRALAALVDRIGPAVVMVHSQSGAYGIGAAIARPDSVKAVVSVEPRSCAVPDEKVKAVFTRVRLLSIFGDFFDTNVADWPGRMAECVESVNRIKTAHGFAENIHLPACGIRGNSHMLMMDMNNLQIADLILAWLADNAR
ncbi:MAG: esterase [Bryobacterales bacterium]|nr:esterase [Bryobacterales bacterium]